MMELWMNGQEERLREGHDLDFHPLGSEFYIDYRVFLFQIILLSLLIDVILFHNPLFCYPVTQFSVSQLQAQPQVIQAEKLLVI